MRAHVAAGAALPLVAAWALLSGSVSSAFLALAAGLVGVAFVQLAGVAGTLQRSTALALGLLVGLAAATVSFDGLHPMVLVEVQAAGTQLRSVVGFANGNEIETLARPLRVVLPGSDLVLGAWVVAGLGALVAARLGSRAALALAGSAAVITIGVAGASIAGLLPVVDASALSGLVEQQQPVGSGRASSIHSSLAEGPFTLASAAAWIALGFAMLAVLVRGAIALRRSETPSDVRGATLLTCAVLAVAGLAGLVVALGTADVAWFSDAPLARAHALAMVGVGLVLTGAMRRERAVVAWLGLSGAVLGWVLASLQVFR